MNTQWVLGWQNLIYVLPFGMALIYLFLYAVSGVTFGETDADHDLDADADADMDADAEIDHDVAVDGDLDADADVDADADADMDADADQAAGSSLSAHGHGGHGDYVGDSGNEGGGGAAPGLLQSALVWIGFGRVPLSLLLMVLLFSWGAAGFITNQAVRESFADGWRVILVSIPVAAVLSILITRVVVRSIDRWLPMEETTARRQHDLLGLQGVAMYDINDRFGMVTLRDDRGELHQVACRVAEGHPPIAKNEGVTLVAYNRRDHLYKVIAPAQKPLTPGESRPA